MSLRIQVVALLLTLAWTGPFPAWAKKRATPTPSPTATATSTATLIPSVSPTPTPEELFKLDQVWGSPGGGLGQLNDPEGLWISPDGRLAIADSENHRIQVWDTDGKPIRAVGSFGSGASWRNPPQFNHPEGVMLHPSGQMYVADTNNHRIVVVDARGMAVTAWGHQGTDAGNFDQPHAFALGRYLDLWVLDTGNSRLQLFSPQGVFKKTWGTFGSEPGQVKNPEGVALNFIEQLQVADTGNCRYQVINSDGNPVTWQGWCGDGPNQYREPGGIAIIPAGWIAVVDGTNGRVLLYNHRFEYLSDWTAVYDPAWKLPAPHFKAIACDPQSRLYLSDVTNNVIVRLSPQRKVPLLEAPKTPIPTSQDNLYGGQGFPLR